MSNSLGLQEQQHTRPPCPTPTPGVYPNSCPLNQWCHPTISSPGVPFSSRLRSFPESGSFPVSQFFTSGGQSIGVSASTSGLISFRMDWLDLLEVQGTLKNLLQHHSSKASILWHCLSLGLEWKLTFSSMYSRSFKTWSQPNFPSVFDIITPWVCASAKLKCSLFKCTYIFSLL